MSEELHDEAAAQDTMAVAGTPASQWEAEHPSDEAREQEAREIASRMPAGAYDRDEAGEEADEEAAADAEPAAPAEPAGPAEPAEPAGAPAGDSAAEG